MFYFIAHFSKENKREGFFVGFIVFFLSRLKKKLVFFGLGPITSTLKIIMDVKLNFCAKFRNCPI